ncbi:O-methyltransferase-domain-containing protein [Chaetomium tenue]|uniref:O-methyltransferase-domain-containing protein n=1 Tax=Chaetomium tenue TaxID=1854479 RepID=A0ACB7P7S3_9PEZI|nr:O-methyltransferase-domain-containing protein [Chaetomium globosum]
MATQLTSNHGTPGLVHGTGITPPSDMDAVETLKAVQGIISTYLANGTTGGRSRIPTPEPSPVPKFLEVSKQEVNGMNGGQAEILREDAGQLSKGVLAGRSAEDIGAVSGQQQAAITGPEPANITSQAPQVAQNLTTDQLNRGVLNHAAANTLDADNMKSQGPAARMLHGDSKTNGSDIKASPPSVPPQPSQERLLKLTSDIAQNISQIATDDSARIKALTDALELAAALRPPGDTIMGWFANMSVISAVRLFIHWGAFDIIPPSKGESIAYSKLAAQVNADEGLIVRVASMLTSSHILLHHPTSPTHPAPSLSHTPISSLLISGQPMSAMFSLMYNHVTAVSTILPSYFDTYGRTEPTGPAHIPTSFLAGQPEQDFFSLLKKDDAALKNFGLAMRMTSKRVPVTGVYDMAGVLRAAEAGRETVWVDVGGGDGHTVKQFLGEYPGLRAEQCVVQDLEEVVEAARGQDDEVLRGVRWVGMDFFKEPPVEGALIYYLRHIIRDYSDPVAATILRNIARAMTDPASRVLVSEQLNPDVASTDGPLPLYAAFKDFSMLSIGGKERSLSQFEALADTAGLRVSGVYGHAATGHAVVELALKG